MATWQRDHEGHPIAGDQLIAHHDAGSQYTAVRSTEHLAAAGIADSIGAAGELPHGVRGWPVQDRVHQAADLPRPAAEDPADVEFATMASVDRYNNRRLHFSLGMLTPTEYEAAQ
jgi:transposase InsO family protein